MGYTRQVLFASSGKRTEDYANIRNFESRPCSNPDYVVLLDIDDSDVKIWDLGEVSRQCGEAFGLFYQTWGDDSLVYSHWKEGEVVRALW